MRNPKRRIALARSHMNIVALYLTKVLAIDAASLLAGARWGAAAPFRKRHSRRDGRYSVRFTPESRHVQRQNECLLCAISGHSSLPLTLPLRWRRAARAIAIHKCNDWRNLICLTFRLIGSASRTRTFATRQGVV